MLDDGLVQSARLTGLLFDFFVQSVSFGVGSSELSGFPLEITLVVHTILNDLAEFILVTILQVINFNPGFIFDLLSTGLVFELKLFNHFLFLLILVVFLQLLKRVLLLHLGFGFVVLQEQLLNVLLEFNLLLFLGGDEGLGALFVSQSLLVVLLFLYAAFLFVDLFQILLFFFRTQVNLFFFHGQLSRGLLKERLLLVNLFLKCLDFLIVLGHSVL